MIDQDGDGFVDEKDLGKMLQQLGELVGLQGAASALADPISMIQASTQAHKWSRRTLMQHLREAVPSISPPS